MKDPGHRWPTSLPQGLSWMFLSLFLLLTATPTHVVHVRTRYIDNNESLQPDDDRSVESIDTSHYLEKSEVLAAENRLKKLNKKIPMTLLKQLQDIATYDELMKKMMEPGKKLSHRSLRNQANWSKNMRSKNFSKSPEDLAPLFDKKANCQPRRVPVHVPQPMDPMLIYQPMCIQIERCGGCCPHELLKCVPSLRRNASRKIVALRYPHAGANYFEYEKVTTVKIERHVRCKCQCKVQPEDCTPHQVYNKDSCRCLCPNSSGPLKCKAPQIWNEKDCKCRCPDQGDCSTGTYFDTRGCRCRSMAEILSYARIYKNPWLKTHLAPLQETRTEV